MTLPSLSTVTAIDPLGFVSTGMPVVRDDGDAVDGGGEQAGVALHVGAPQRLTCLQRHIVGVGGLLDGDETLGDQRHILVHHSGTLTGGQRLGVEDETFLALLVLRDRGDLEIEWSLGDFAHRVGGDQQRGDE